jgi:hypothetical protein
MNKVEAFIEDFLEYHNDPNMPMSELVARAKAALEELRK